MASLITFSMIYCYNFLLKNYFSLLIIGLLPAFCLLSQRLVAQRLDSIQLAKQPTFNSITKALKNPEKVYILDLSNQKLWHFPKEILQCKNIQKLILHTNYLTEIPNEISELKYLEYIDFYYNRLQNLPQTMSSLAYLQYIDIGKNRFHQIPMFLLSLPSLHTLLVYANPLRRLNLGESKPIAPLHTLRLGSTKLKRLPANIEYLSNLEELYLPDNQLKKLPESLSNLSRLRYVVLDNNRFRQLPKPLYALPNLQYLSIWNRGFRQESITELQNIASKPQLQLSERYAGYFTAVDFSLQQGNYTNLGVGITRGYLKDIIGSGLSLQGHYTLQNQAWGASAGIWFNALVHIGLQGFYQQQNTQNAWGICPTIGWGIRKMSLSYGYNIAFQKAPNFLNSHHCTLRYALSINP